MLPVRFENIGTVLCLGAHSDDIEIGAGATVLKLVAENPSAKFIWVVLSAHGKRGEEAGASATRFLDSAKEPEILLKTFRDGHFPDQWAQIKQFFEELKAHADPDLILTQYGGDRHQDHRVVAELTWNTYRNHQILEYEIPKYDGGMGSPNFFVPASTEYADRKIRYLTECFASQADKHWFDDLTFRGLMRLRGLECCAESALAEGFYVRKICLG